MASAYLFRRRRGLRETCLEIMEGRNIEPPCARCRLDDLCELCLGDPLKTNLTGQFSYSLEGGTFLRRLVYYVPSQQIH